MLDFYYLGCLIAFICGFIRFLRCLYHYIYEKTDIETENYKELGYSYDFFDMGFSNDKKDWGNFVFGIFLHFGIFTLLSRISVLFYVFSLIKRIKWKFDLPKDIREDIKKNEFKLKNTKILSKKELYEIVYFINHGQKIHQSGDLTQNLLLGDVDTTPEDEEYDRSHLYVYYDKLRLWSSSIPVVEKTVLEYKIEGNKVLGRIIEECREDPSKDDFYPIKDGKVCKEEEIRKYFKVLPEKIIEERIENYKSSVKWFILNDEITDYVLYYNLSRKDFEDYANTKIKNLKIGKKIYEEVNEKYGDTLTVKQEKTYVSKKLKEYGLTKQDIGYSWTRDKDIKRLNNILNGRIYS